MKWVWTAILAIVLVICGCGGGGGSSLSGSGSSGLTTGTSTTGSSSSGSTSGTSGATGTTTGTTTGGTSGTIASLNEVIGSGSLTLDDGGHYAVAAFIGNAVGTASVSVTSTDFDAFTIVEEVNANGTSDVIAEDDNGDGGTNSLVTFHVDTGSHYSVIVTTPSGDPSGTAVISYPVSLLSPFKSGQSASTGGGH